jgi:hypothetical protein
MSSCKVKPEFRHTQTVIDERIAMLSEFEGIKSSTELPLKVDWALRSSGHLAMGAVLLNSIVSHASKIHDTEAIKKVIAEVARMRAVRGVPPVRWLVPPLPLLPQLQHANWGDDLTLIQMFMVLDILKEALRDLRVLEDQISTHLQELTTAPLCTVFANGKDWAMSDIRVNDTGELVFDESPPNGAVFS